MIHFPYICIDFHPFLSCETLFFSILSAQVTWPYMDRLIRTLKDDR